MKRFLLVFFNIFILSTITGCAFALASEISQEVFSTEETVTIDYPASSQTPPLTPSLPQSSGPYLLIQSDFAQYQIIDISRKNTYPFVPPDTENSYNLSKILSPSRRLIFFPLSSNKIALVDLPSGQIIEQHSRFDGQSKFNIEQAVEEAKTLLKENFHSDEAFSTMIEDSYHESLHDIRWYQNDNQWLVASESTPTSTSLNLYNLENRSFEKLENQPGFVLDYWFGPGGSQILLKKGYSNDPSLWQGFHYYVLDINNRQIIL